MVITALVVVATAVTLLTGIKLGNALCKEAAWVLGGAAADRPGRVGVAAALGRPVRPARRDPRRCWPLMWLFWPSRRLPRNRVRYQRWRLRCRLRPGRGHANVFELNTAWSRRAAFGESSRTRPSLGGWWARATAAAVAYSVFIGRAQYRHGARIPLQEHVAVIAPPRTGKSGWLGTVIAHYPGPVISTTTKPDLYEHTGAVRGQRGPVHVFNPQGIGGVPSTFAWNPLDGCQDPADRGPPRRRVRLRRIAEGRRRRQVLGVQGVGLPARPVPGGRARRVHDARGVPVGAAGSPTSARPRTS